MFHIESELVRLLMRVGYAAAWNGLHKEAISMFDGVGAARPESELPVIGAAVVALLSGNYDVAAKTLLEGALQLNPESALARAHLGVVLRMRGDEEAGMAILREVSEQTTDADAAAMALNVISLSADQIKPNLKML